MDSVDLKIKIKTIHYFIIFSCLRHGIFCVTVNEPTINNVLETARHLKLGPNSSYYLMKLFQIPFGLTQS